MTKDTFEEILGSFPPKPSRSRLEPYAELILELHRRGRTYREIVRILSERCNFQTSRSTLNDFVHTRAKRARSFQKRVSAEPKPRPQNSAPLPKPTLSSETEDATDDIQKRIAALKRRPVPNETGSSQLFNYDPDKPLHLSRKKPNNE